MEMQVFGGRTAAVGREWSGPNVRMANGGAWRVLGFFAAPDVRAAAPAPFRILTFGSVGVLAVPAEAWEDRRLPVSFPGGASVVRVSPAPVFAGLEGITAAVHRTAGELAEILADRRGCQEIRVALMRPEGATEGGPGPSQQEARMTARLAQTVTGLSRRTRLTPPALRPRWSGEVRLALSLLLGPGALPEVYRALALGRALARPLELSLMVTNPGPAESFPLTGWNAPLANGA